MDSVRYLGDPRRFYVPAAELVVVYFALLLIFLPVETTQNFKIKLIKIPCWKLVSF